MTIEIEPGRYFSHFWFVGCETKDFLACLWREDKPDAEWHLQYRFRYYKDQSVFDSEDEKRSYSAVAPANRPEESLVEAVDKIAALTKMQFCSEDVHKVVVKSSDAAHVIDVISKQPWMHLQPTGEVN
jgi:hypothetical protein